MGRQRNTFIIIIVLVIVMMIYVVSYIFSNNIDRKETYRDPIMCPRPEESFDSKKFLQKGDCYMNGVTTCKGIAEFMNLPTSFDGLTEEQYETAMSVLGANVYQSSVSTDTEKYNINECVISQKDAQDLNINGCTIGNIELRDGNKPDVSLSWLHPQGCVITEQNMRNNLGSILKGIYSKLREAPDATQTLFRGRIKENEDATSAHWSAYNSNVTTTSQRRSDEANANTRDINARNSTIWNANEEVRATNNKHALIPKANHNQAIDTRMKRDCKWDWSAWTPCQGECGTGKQSREVIIQLEPVNGGWACPTNRKQEQACNTGKVCPRKASYTVHRTPIASTAPWGNMTVHGHSVRWIYAPGTWNVVGGTTFEYIHTVSENSLQVEFSFRMDDGGPLHLNDRLLMRTNNWQTQHTVVDTMVKGQNMVRLYNWNNGGPLGIAVLCRRTDNGTVLFQTGRDQWKCS